MDIPGTSIPRKDLLAFAKTCLADYTVVDYLIGDSPVQLIFALIALWIRFLSGVWTS